MKLCIGLIGDLADAFPDGQIKQFLLAEWIMTELRTKGRMPSETRKTLRWAREVCLLKPLFISCPAYVESCLDGEASYCIETPRCPALCFQFFFSNNLHYLSSLVSYAQPAI